MAVRVGSARIDSRGKASGDKAGDQTGKEVAIENYYVHKQGWYVVRAKKAAVREKIAQDMEYACANKYIGYDQGENQTLWHVAGKVGYNCSKVKTPCETDCGRLDRVCVWYAGVKAPDFNTETLAKVLAATGEFEVLKDAKHCNSSAYLKRGDILVTRTKGHTVVVLDDGSETKKAKEAEKKPAASKPAASKPAASKPAASKPAAKTPTYKVGKNYKIIADALNVRYTPAGKKKPKKALTADGQKHATPNGALKKGTPVTCKGTKNVGGNIWMQIPSGWIAAYYNKKKYVK